MIIKLDTDLVLPIAVAILAITLTIGHQTLVPISSVEEIILENELLFTEISMANHEIDILTKELKAYRTIEERLSHLGASHTEAVTIIKASRLYSLDPIALGALIASESSFHDTHHDIPTVIGMCGINTVANPILPHNPHTASGNIYCAAYLLRQYLDLYGTYTLAFKRYKGWSSLGYSQSLHVQHIRSTI